MAIIIITIVIVIVIITIVVIIIIIISSSSSITIVFFFSSNNISSVDGPAGPEGAHAPVAQQPVHGCREPPNSPSPTSEARKFESALSKPGLNMDSS